MVTGNSSRCIPCIMCRKVNIHLRIIKQIILFSLFIIPITGCTGLSNLPNTRFVFRVFEDNFYPNITSVHSEDYVMLLNVDKEILSFNPFCWMGYDDDNHFIEVFDFYFLYRGDHWKHLNTLKIINSRSDTLDCNQRGVWDRQISNDLVSETLAFRINEEILKKLIDEGQFSIILSGREDRIDYTFSESYISELRKFYKLSVETYNQKMNRQL